MTDEADKAVQTLKTIITVTVKHRGYNKQAIDALHQLVAEFERLESEHDRPASARKRPRT